MLIKAWPRFRGMFTLRVNSQCVTYVAARSQLPVNHLFLHQVLHPAHLHLVHVVHERGPIRAPFCAHQGLWLTGGVNRGRIVVGGGHAVAAVADPEAPQARGDARAGEGPPAALAGNRPVMSVHLWEVTLMSQCQL